MPPDTRRLTEAHRRAQVRIGAQTARQASDAWPLLDPQDLDGSFARWLRVVLPLIQQYRGASATVAASYVAALRRLVLGGDDGFVAAPAPLVAAERLITSMLLTGPASVRNNLAKGVPLERALDIAQGRTAASAMRHALDGGRQTILEAVRSDERAIGWQRVTSGKTCDFCSMLADRGAVYGEASADFQAHDGCSCAAEPVFS